MKKFASVLMLLTTYLSCENPLGHSHDVEGNVDWASLKKGIIEMDAGIVLPEINKLLTDLNPDQTILDPTGQKANIDKLLVRLNLAADSISAELVCFACILTNPPQTEISLRTDSSGSDIQRIIDILTPSDSKLKAIRMH